MFRWQGIIPLVLAGALTFAGWTLFGGRILRTTLSEAGTDAMGAQFDIAEARVAIMATTVELRGITLADPFDPNRNLFEIARLRLELEPRPLLEKKIVVRRLGITDVRTSTRRETPAQPSTGGGFAPRALAEVRRFAGQFNVPLLSLTPFDTFRAIALDPSQLHAVQATVALGHSADSVKSAIEAAYASLRLQETLDSSAALATRLQGTNVRTLGLDGARRAVTDLRTASARIDSAKRRVDALVADARRGIDTLQAGVGAIDAARREDYAFARGLLKLPTFDAPDIGAALFGKVTIDRFQQAVYWATLAREHAPPGLLPRESVGPQRRRRSGTTLHFARQESHPRFLLRRADVNVSIGGGGGAAAGEYAIAASDITTEPAIVGRPTLFAARRVGGGDVDSVRITGSIDHVSANAREVVNVNASGVRLPPLALPVLPYTMDPGRGTSELRFMLDGDRLAGRWSVRSGDLTWSTDSARARAMNSIETLVARALTGIRELDLVADVSGTIAAPRLAVRSNLDRQIAARLRAVIGEEVTAMQTKVRAEVDRVVEERSAPVRARIVELRAESDRRIADARSRLDAEKARLEERLRALSGGVSIPGIGGGTETLTRGAPS
ncbi:MAG: hypothetical protein WD801_11215 [Gemmatimonadaceae bacterium]